MKEAPSFLLQAGRGLATTKKREKGEHQPMQQLSLSLSLSVSVSLFCLSACVWLCVCVCLSAKCAYVTSPLRWASDTLGKREKEMEKGLIQRPSSPFSLFCLQLCVQRDVYTSGRSSPSLVIGQSISFLFLFFTATPPHRPAHRAFWKKTISYCVSCKFINLLN